MTSPNDILREIRRLVAERYPGVMVYVNLCPIDYVRPSFLVESTGVLRKDANKATVEITASYTITCYLEVDERHNTDTEALLIRQSEVVDLFRAGYIRVGDRAIGIQSNEGGMDFFEAYVDITVDYFDDRAEAEDLPLMETVDIKYNTGGITI